MKKIIKWTLIIVPVVLIIVIVVVMLMLNGIVRSAVEKQATASTHLNTTLASANVSVMGGTVRLDGLKIAPPQGYASPEMFSTKGLSVAVSYSQLTSNPIHISDIVIDEPHLTLEQQGTSFNVKVAMDQMPKSEPSTMRLIIDTMRINNTKVTIKTNIPFVPPEMNMQLPSIALKNIGNADGNQNGAAVKDVLKQVLAAMMDEVQKSGKVPAGMGSLMSGDTQAIQDQARAAATQAVDKARNDAQEKINKGLGDFLNGKK